MMLAPAFLSGQEPKLDKETGEHLVLPEWSREDQRVYDAGKKRFPGLGGGLWPPELYPLPALERPPLALTAYQAEEEGDDTNSVPELARAASQVRQESGTEPLPWKFPVLSLAASAPELMPEELSAAQTDLYFGQKPAELLTDPPRLLTETQKDDVARLLANHDRDSEIPLYLFLLSGSQRLPRDLDLSRLTDAWFGETSACVLMVHLGATRESQVMFTSALRKKIGSRELDVWLQECITSAQIASEPIDQVERFVAQNSLRIFWLEKMLHPLPVTQADENSGKLLYAAAFLPAPAFLLQDQPPWDQTIYPSAWTNATGLVLLLILGSGMVMRWRRRRSSLFAPPPLSGEKASAAYLAAPHSGGHGVSLGF